MADPDKQSDLQLAVVEWLRCEREGQLRQVMIAELTRIARHIEVWPTATPAQWERAIDAAIAAGDVAERSGKLVIVPKIKTPPPDQQLQLF